MILHKMWLLPATIFLLQLSVTPTNGLFLMTSLLMAMNGGLLMSKMSLGGLMLMMLSAEQRRNGGQGIFAYLQNLGANNAYPAIGKRSSRSISGDEAFFSNETNPFIKTIGKNATDEEIQTRIIRQISGFDPMKCIPKLVCSVNTKPPSDQTSVLNDYAYLLKDLFLSSQSETGAGTNDDLEEEDLGTLKKNKKKKQNTEEDYDDFSSDEDEYTRLMLQERYEIEQMANEEIVNDNPAFLNYALKDHNRYPFPPGAPNGPRPGPPPPPPMFRMPPGVSGSNVDNKYRSPATVGNHDYLDNMSSAQLQGMLSKLKQENTPSKYNPLGYLYPSDSSEKSSSLLSKFIPKLSFGFSSKKSEKDPVFADDPFFANFKRSLTQSKANSLEKSEQEFNQVIKQRLITRISRKLKENEYVQRKKKELSQITDPLDAYKIALNVGQETRNARQCRMLFDGCPFKYDEILKMVGDMRKAIMGHPEVTNATKVDPKATTGTGTVVTTNGQTASGVTSIIHQLPNGEKVEIKLQMGGGNAVVKTNNSTTEKKPQKVPQKPKTDPKESIESLQATILAIQKINEAAVQQQGGLLGGASKNKYTVTKPATSLPTAFQDFLELSELSSESTSKVKKPLSSIVEELSGPSKIRRPGGAVDDSEADEKSEEESSEESSDDYEDEEPEYYSFGKRQLTDEEDGKEDKDGRIIVRIGKKRYVNRMTRDFKEIDEERQKQRSDHRSRILEQMIAKNNNPSYNIRFRRMYAY